MMVVGSRSANHIATVLLPAAVGPQITRTSASAETAVKLVPGQLHDRRATVDVVRGKRRVAQRGEQGTHLRGRQRVAGLDRRLASDRGGESLMPLVHAGLAVAGNRRQRLAKAALRIEARMRHWNGAKDEGMSAEPLDLKPKPVEHFTIPLVRLGLGRPEMKRHRKEQTLPGA